MPRRFGEEALRCSGGLKQGYPGFEVGAMIPKGSYMQSTHTVLLITKTEIIRIGLLAACSGREGGNWGGSIWQSLSV